MPHPPSQVPFGQAWRFWLRLGFISFGGPAGQIALMHQELVDRRRWISERRFLHALNYCMVLPGPEAQQLATYLGWLMHRTWGGILAGALFVLPSLLLLIGLSWAYITWGQTPWMSGLFLGIQPAVAAIVLQAAHRIGSRALKGREMWAIAALSFVATAAFDVPFPAIVIAAALGGLLIARVSPHRIAPAASHHAATASHHTPALIDDDTPPPAHARFSRSRLMRVVAAGALLWLGTMGLLVACYGWEHTLAQMGWFFTKAALMTFGGAYAVLPYVFQGAVEHHGWLQASQMMDGLALGESTPGPLIMVVAFVGYIGGHVGALFGPDARFLAGATAAVVVTWFTFLPSFLFILAGGPLVESTHGKLQFTAPLAAITAAVVGAILELARFFTLHVIWPHGTAQPMDWLAVATLLGAAVALIRYRTPVLPTLAVCAITGVMRSWV